MAGGSFGGTVKLNGESEYQKALKGIADNFKVLNSEMKVVTSQYDKNDNSSKKLKQTSEILTKKIGEQGSKVDILKSALEHAKKETGENSSTTKKWQTALNDAVADLNHMNRELKEQGDNMDESSEKASRLGDIIKGNLISEGIIAGIKGLGKAISAVGSAFADVGKQAIQSYAQYEQLVGGVDTLSGSSSQKVQEYANNAYKTAGLSANEYMETVTSFSASLISSLNGDTEKASEVANRAIIDMSDNANKMGTDMSSLQNAYQGFAKQNYTMLDNLKLGYGGTKEEMARLISDASKMTNVQKELGITVAEGDMSFANIANAISVVQKNMGLMGTTALEADGTISGSTGSMKSAWANLLTGIADDNANFGQLVDNLVVSIVGKDGEGGFINNMLPRIQQALDGIVQMVVSLTDSLLPKIVDIGTNLITNLVSSINENLPTLMEGAGVILSTLIEGIVTTFPQLVPMVMQMFEVLVTTIMDSLPMIIDAGVKVLVSFVQGIAGMLPTLIPTIVSAIILMVETLLSNIDLIIDAGISLITGLGEGLVNAIPLLIKNIPTIIGKLLMAILESIPKLLKAGWDLLCSLGEGIVNAIPQLWNKAKEAVANFIKPFLEMREKMLKMGGDLLRGLWEGIKDVGQWLWDKISGFFGGIVDGIKDFFGINSPSKLFKEEIGENLALGVGEGFGDTMQEVSKDMQGAIPTDFDTAVNMSTQSSSYGSNYDHLVTAFKEALKDVKVVMNNREMGAFIVDTVEREVYA